MADAAKITDSDRTIGALLGSAEFPHYPNLTGGQAFAASVTGFQSCLATQFGSKWCETNILDLFNSQEDSSRQLRRLGQFLEEHLEATRLIAYYVGHGTFLRNRNYYLTLQVTEKGNEHITSLDITDLAITIDNHFPGKNVFLILDCCFAGEAMAAFQGTGDLNRLIEKQTFDVFPAGGTSLLCASSKDEPAISDGINGRTMFSGALIDVLQTGVTGKDETLSLRDIQEAVEKVVKTRHGMNAVRPEVHSPRQQGADIAKHPLFKNIGFAPPDPRSLPPDILAPLKNPVPQVRIGAVTALGSLAIGADAELTALIIQRLQRLAELDDKDSVKKAAAETLERLTRDDGPTKTQVTREEDVNTVVHNVRDDARKPAKSKNAALKAEQAARRKDAPEDTSGRPAKDCPFCGTSNRSDRCSQCGQDTRAPRRICSHCGKQTPQASPACTHCSTVHRSELLWKVPLIIGLFVIAVIITVLINIWSL